MSEAILFGMSGDPETEVALIEVADWADAYEIPIVFVEMTNEVIQDNDLDPLVTMWWDHKSDHENGGPITKVVGLADILEMVMP